MRPATGFDPGWGQLVPQRMRCGLACDQRAGERRDVCEIGLRRHRIGAAGNLHIRLSRFHQIHERAEAGLVEPARGRRAAEVIDDERHGRREKLRAERLDDRQLRVELNVPAPLRCARATALSNRWRATAGSLMPAVARFRRMPRMPALPIASSSASVVLSSITATPRARLAKRAHAVERARVVGAVHARLHDDDALEAKRRQAAVEARQPTPSRACRCGPRRTDTSSDRRTRARGNRTRRAGRRS